MLSRSNCSREGLNNTLKVVGLCLLLPSGAAWAENCFSTPKNLPNTPQGWKTLQESLKKDTQHCLKSSVFFALYGAAQLNSGQLNEAIESLERALLLDPNNGAALIDYASALYYSGQLFAAIDLNKQLLAREDLPANLQPMLNKRAQLWQSKTLVQQRRIDVRAGHDSNLNGATFIESITLNFPGQDITLPIEENTRAVAGRYIDVSIDQESVYHSAFSKQTFSVGANLRASEHSDSNYFQLSAAYTAQYTQPKRIWNWDNAIDYLHYNDSPLALTVSSTLKHQWLTNQACQPFIQPSLEHLTVIEQRELNALTFKARGGLLCRFERNIIATRVDYIQDYALSSARPGGDSNGWSVDLQWQRPLFKGAISGELKYSQVRDQLSYNELLDNGARRERVRKEFSLEYSQPLTTKSRFNVSLSKQRQTSNIDLFKQRSTRISVGFNKTF